MTDPLWQLSACDIAEGIRCKTFSCEAVMASVTARIAERNGALNAIVYDHSERAMNQARAADRLAPTLAALLGVAPEAVPAALEEVGDELLFHLITRPHDYDHLRTALVAPVPASPFESDRGADPRVAQVRADLRSPARSARLRALLAAD